MKTTTRLNQRRERFKISFESLSNKKMPVSLRQQAIKLNKSKRRTVCEEQYD